MSTLFGHSICTYLYIFVRVKIQFNSQKQLKYLKKHDAKVLFKVILEANSFRSRTNTSNLDCVDRAGLSTSGPEASLRKRLF